MEKLVCDQCGRTYTDQGSIGLAKDQAEEWARLCKADGVEPRGLIACPVLRCPGEMVLKDG